MIDAGKHPPRQAVPSITELKSVASSAMAMLQDRPMDMMASSGNGGPSLEVLESLTAIGGKFHDAVRAMVDVSNPMDSVNAIHHFRFNGIIDGQDELESRATAIGIAMGRFYQEDASRAEELRSVVDRHPEMSRMTILAAYIFRSARTGGIGSGDAPPDSLGQVFEIPIRSSGDSGWFGDGFSLRGNGPSDRKIQVTDQRAVMFLEGLVFRGTVIFGAGLTLPDGMDIDVLQIAEQAQMEAIPKNLIVRESLQAKAVKGFFLPPIGKGVHIAKIECPLGWADTAIPKMAAELARLGDRVSALDDLVRSLAGRLDDPDRRD